MRKRGFTLIELLVVVAIIVVLISVLLPSLNKARQAAKEVACKANLRSIASAINIYAQENNGSMVVGCAYENGVSPSVYDFYLDRKNYGNIKYRHYSFWALNAAGTIDPKILYCPTDTVLNRQNNFPQSDGGSGRVSYALRGITASSTDPYHLKWGNFSGPTRNNEMTAAIAADRFAGGARMHDKKFSVAFSDGSVLTMFDSADYVYTNSISINYQKRTAIWDAFDKVR